MKQFMAICSRNIKIYLRDKGSLFFSFLSMIIVIGLMLFFLEDTIVDSVVSRFEGIPGRGGQDDIDAARNLIYLWTTAGILAINGATVTLAFYSNMIKDRTGNRLNSIMVMPINRATIVSGYIVSAWIASVVMNVITLAAIEVIAVIKGMELFSFATMIKVILVIMANSFVYSAVMYFFASIIKTEGSWSGFGIVVGTLVGFFGGIYFPIGNISSTVQTIVKCSPVIYGTSLFRKIMMDSYETSFFEGLPEAIRPAFDEKMGVNLKIFENALSISQELFILLGVGVLFALLSMVYLRFSKKTDR